ncbi:hypothetical protein WN51_04433 [Melipona quadrifasciata]|uniref:Uncharacterized protein n=1 Tax=Melipona quadrifasciata TaxID=166423 RepID=A0A0M8ZRY5_9HYME|nr:hypothetical protein WN51_04433 [Melipona quadrifasciata]
MRNTLPIGWREQGIIGGRQKRRANGVSWQRRLHAKGAAAKRTLAQTKKEKEDERARPWETYRVMCIYLLYFPKDPMGNDNTIRDILYLFIIELFEFVIKIAFTYFAIFDAKILRSRNEINKITKFYNLGKNRKLRKEKYGFDAFETEDQLYISFAVERSLDTAAERVTSVNVFHPRFKLQSAGICDGNDGQSKGFLLHTALVEFPVRSNPTYKWVMQHSTNIFIAVQFEKKDQISSSSYRIEIVNENPFVPQPPTCLPTFKFHEYLVSVAPFHHKNLKLRKTPHGLNRKSSFDHKYPVRCEQKSFNPLSYEDF